MALEGKREVILMMNCLNDAYHWSENPCWIYDADFHLLNQPDIQKIICAGARNNDYRLRMLLLGYPADKIVCVDDELDAPDELSYEKGVKICLLHGVNTADLALEVKSKIIAKAEEREGK